MTERILYIVVFTLAVLISPLYAMEKGDSLKVIDQNTLRPVSGVKISDSIRYSISNEEGLVSLKPFDNSDTLSLSRLGYETKIIAASELKEIRLISLNPADIKLEEISITGEGPEDIYSAQERVITGDSESFRFETPGELIAQRSSLSLKDYGSGSLKLISARGMAPENTIVLFNEARVNDLRTGAFNFASLSPLSADRIEINRSDENNLLNPAGGIVRLYSENSGSENRIRGGYKSGPSGGTSFYVSSDLSRGNIAGRAIFERTWSSNHFKYQFEGERLERENSWFSKTFAGAGIDFKSEKHLLKLYSHYSFFENGIPGFVVSNNTASSRSSGKSEALLFIVNSFYEISNRAILKNTINYSFQQYSVYDPAGKIFYSGNLQKSELSEISYNGALNFDFGLMKIKAANYSSYSTLELSGASDNDKLNRFSSRTGMNFSGDFSPAEKIFEKTTWLISGGFEYLGEDYLDSFEGFYKAGLTITPSFYKNMLFYLSYSYDFRNPTFNERYYSRAFNTGELNPEKYHMLEAGAAWSIWKESFRLSLDYFNIAGTNKIIWFPYRAVFQVPRNVEGVRTEGVEFMLAGNMPDNLLQGEIIYTYTDSRNRSGLPGNDNTWNKLLVYTPLHRVNLNLSFNWKNFRLSSMNTWSGKSYYTPDNDEFSSLDSWFISDLSLGYKIITGPISHNIGLNIYNLFNENYFIVQSYPMPLRSFSITYMLTIE